MVYPSYLPAKLDDRLPDDVLDKLTSAPNFWTPINLEVPVQAASYEDVNQPALTTENAIAR